MELQESASWYKYLDKCQQELVAVSFSLVNKENQLLGIKDYSFMVFPMAKAYEGFLKKVFYDLQLISKETYEGRRFRIGRALNPDVHFHQRDEDWLFDNVEMRFGRELAHQLWETWLSCRNRVFHYFSDCQQFLNFDQALSKIEMMINTMNTTINQLEDNKE